MKLSAEQIRTIEGQLERGKAVEIRLEYPAIPGTVERDKTDPRITIVAIERKVISKNKANM